MADAPKRFSRLLLSWPLTANSGTEKATNKSVQNTRDNLSSLKTKFAQGFRDGFGSDTTSIPDDEKVSISEFSDCLPEIHGQAAMSRAAGVAHGACVRRQRKSFIFGETDYLRDKLGFCMPSVKQTLATEHQQLDERGAHGFHNIAKQRLRTVQRLIERSAATHRQRFLSRGSSYSRSNSKDLFAPKKHPRKGTLHSQQYIILLDANTRRAKQIDDKAKFAVTQEVCRQEAARQSLERKMEYDTKLAQETRSEIDKEKERQRRKRKLHLEEKIKKLKPQARPKPKNGSDSSSTSSSAQTTLFKFD